MIVFRPNNTATTSKKGS